MDLVLELTVPLYFNDGFVSHRKLIQSILLYPIYFYSFIFFLVSVNIFSSIGFFYFRCLDKIFTMSLESQ